jgi:hypothetical protein
MNMYNENEIDQTMQAWMLGKRFTADAKTNALIRQRVEEYLEAGGYVAVSHFERAYLELLNQDLIQPFRGSITDQPSAAPAVSQDTIAFIESPRTTASQLRNRYNTDPMFRKQYDLYEKTKTRESSGSTLTVEEYRNMRAADVVQRYRRDAVFKSGVDKLIAQGKI